MAGEREAMIHNWRPMADMIAIIRTDLVLFTELMFFSTQKCFKSGVACSLLDLGAAVALSMAESLRVNAEALRSHLSKVQ
ncbi:hypothetical protein C1752_02806 [Acaryochloris thomasi RCC1774]|uniref:Uncharacterized protein n=1 Tax=Acaryochloris thomasi RCC1774 TaxID=1764569 RepID=A0A2W1JQF4_9CYAN|nr:hypothetical protein C1752_02806 [Acaryochloris thomasi RCC1774]